MNGKLRKLIERKNLSHSDVHVDLSMEDLEFLMLEILKGEVSTGLPNSTLTLEVDEFSDSEVGLTAFMLTLTNLSELEHVELSELLCSESEMDAPDDGVTFETDKLLQFIFEDEKMFTNPVIKIVTNQGEAHIYRVLANEEIHTSVKLHIYLPGVNSQEEIHEKLSKLLGEDVSFQIYETEIQ